MLSRITKFQQAQCITHCSKEKNHIKLILMYFNKEDSVNSYKEDLGFA